MKSLLQLAVLLLIPSVTQVSAQNPEPPKPTTPLVRRAPEMASWTITFTSAKSPGTPPPPSQFVVDRPASITVVKTDRTYWEVTTMKSGQKTSRWICNGVELITLPGSDKVCYVAHNDIIIADAFDYSKSDFQGLEWISLENYQGIKSSEGKPTFAFEIKPTNQNAKPGTNVSAMLSIKTQLPLNSTDSFGVLRTYTYNTPPTSPLVPPEDFRKVFKEFGINF